VNVKNKKPISMLTETFQKFFRSVKFKFTVISSNTTTSKAQPFPMFELACEIDKILIAKSTGKSKKIAKHGVAKKTLEVIFPKIFRRWITENVGNTDP
jgi:hypothetical protein